MMAVVMCEAQNVKIMYKGEVLTKYNIDKDWEIVFSESSSEESHEYVEIGGKKWATMNLGATTVAGNPATCYGDYYAWGEIVPRYTSKTITSATSITFEWKSDFGYANNVYPSFFGTSLGAPNDAATQTWGGSWRMPTKDDFFALCEACGWTELHISQQNLPSGNTSTSAKGIYWCSNYNGAVGVLFCDGNNHKLFFPAAGNINNKTLSNGGTIGYYWFSSSESGKNSMSFTSTSILKSNAYSVFYGFTIRPISDL